MNKKTKHTPTKRKESEHMPCKNLRGYIYICQCIMCDLGIFTMKSVSVIKNKF